MRLPILLYHRIDDIPKDAAENSIYTSPETFEQHLRWMTRLGWRFITFSQMADNMDSGQAPKGKTAVITFDDGHRDNFTTALPIMQRYNALGTIFVVAGEIGNTLRFECSQPDGEQILTTDEILALIDAGVDIQSHGMTHRRLTDLTDAEVLAEMKDSKQVLEDLTRKRIDLFAYPFGSVRRSFETLAKQAGYRAAVSTYRGRSHNPESERYFLKRISALSKFEGHPFVFLNHLMFKSYARSQKSLDAFLREDTIENA